MTAEENLALARIEAALLRNEDQVRFLRGETMARFDAHEARHQTMDDASRARHQALANAVLARRTEDEHRMTAIEVALGPLQRDTCALRKRIDQRTLVGGVLVALGAGAGWLAQALGFGKPGP